MARIRFEDVTITAKAIELYDIEDPSALLEGMGLKGATVNEPLQGALPLSEPVALPLSEPAGEDPKALVNILAPSSDNLIHPSEFKKARRLRDVIQVFVDHGIQGEQEIVKQCLGLKEEVGLLKRVVDIEGRMPKALKKFQEDRVAN